MSSADTIKGRDGAVIIPVEWSYLLDEANARINAILRERDGEATS